LIEYFTDIMPRGGHTIVTTTANAQQRNETKV